MTSWLNRATLDIIANAAFGYEVDSLRNPEEPLAKAYASIFAFDFVSNLVMAVRMHTEWAEYIPVRINRILTRARIVIKTVAHDIVGNQLKCTDKSVLGRAMAYNDGAVESDRLSMTTIEDQIMTFLAAGHDTTATGVGWTLDLLAKHPDIQETLRSEILEALPDIFERNVEDLASFNLDSLAYLNKVCLESLRYIPPIPILLRECLADCNLAGYHIPKGSWVNIIPNAINRLPCYWGDDPDTFNPERWDHLPESWCPTAYATFLQGPRGCIGRKFAETEMKVLLCCLLARFRVERDVEWPNQELRKEWRLVNRPRDGIRVILKPL